MQKLVYGGSKAAEEFNETQYYKDLNGVDKQHHTVRTISQIILLELNSKRIARFFWQKSNTIYFMTIVQFKYLWLGFRYSF